MPLIDFGDQVSVELSTLVILILSVILSIFLTQAYFTRKKISYVSWSIGLWLFAIGVLEELLFSIGYYNEPLIKSYLFIVAVLVQFLAFGSIQLTHSRRVRTGYYVYSAVASVFLIAILVTSNIGNILSSSVVYGQIPLLVTVGSALMTFPAALIILAVAIMGYRKTRDKKMISIIAGVIVVSAAGTLYIASFPAFLYLAEFVGILLLWLGFVDFGKVIPSSSPTRS